MAGRTAKVPVNPAFLTWAREQSGYPIAEAAKSLAVKPERLQVWEAGEAQPTVVQLGRLAKLYQQTTASFFLETTPAAEVRPPPDFRGRESGGGLTPALIRELRRADERRRTFLELRETPDFVPPDLTTAPAAAADVARIREWLKFPIDEQMRTRDGSDALSHWIGCVEDAGVLVFQMSRLDSAEARGFSISEEKAPVIVLNGSEPPQARAFTLLHELRHLIDRTGGLCTLWSDRRAERQCNLFAANVLMPADVFLSELGDDPPIDAVAQLARKFRVSRDAAAIRLQELGKLEDAAVDDVRAETARQVAERKAKQREQKPQIPHYRTHLRNLGPRYVTTVLDALDAEVISTTDASYFLEAKLSTVDRMTAELAARGVR
jgi:Zn-dependent peptidase ImmA (M78 family)